MSKSIEVCVYGLLAVLFIIILFNYWTFNAGMDVLLIIGLVSTVVMGVKTLKKV